MFAAAPPFSGGERARVSRFFICAPPPPLRPRVPGVYWLYTYIYVRLAEHCGGGTHAQGSRALCSVSFPQRSDGRVVVGCRAHSYIHCSVPNVIPFRSSSTIRVRSVERNDNVIRKVQNIILRARVVFYVPTRKKAPRSPVNDDQNIISARR